jgi:hypothetical protein
VPSSSVSASVGSFLLLPCDSPPGSLCCDARIPRSPKNKIAGRSLRSLVGPLCAPVWVLAARSASDSHTNDAKQDTTVAVVRGKGQLLRRHHDGDIIRLRRAKTSASGNPVWIDLWRTIRIRRVLTRREKRGPLHPIPSVRPLEARRLPRFEDSLAFYSDRNDLPSHQTRSAEQPSGRVADERHSRWRRLDDECVCGLRAGSQVLDLDSCDADEAEVRILSSRPVFR